MLSPPSDLETKRSREDGLGTSTLLCMNPAAIGIRAPRHTRFLPHPRMDAASRFCSFLCWGTALHACQLGLVRRSSLRTELRGGVSFSGSGFTIQCWFLSLKPFLEAARRYGWGQECRVRKAGLVPNKGRRRTMAPVLCCFRLLEISSIVEGCNSEEHAMALLARFLPIPATIRHGSSQAIAFLDCQYLEEQRHSNTQRSQSKKQICWYQSYHPYLCGAQAKT